MPGKHGREISKFAKSRQEALDISQTSGGAGLAIQEGFKGKDGSPVAILELGNYRGRSIPRTFMRELKVEGGMPSRLAAPSSPETRQRQASRARTMLLRSIS